MATEKPSYTPTQWKNENEGGDVPDINAENLNHIEQGLKDIYDYAIEKLLNNDDFASKLVERIVNTGTTSEAGYAADARQLNPNQSGSLAQQITQLKSEMITITIKDYEVTLTSSSGSGWGYSYGFSLSENGDLPTGTQLVIPIACGLKANWNITGMVSIHQNDFVRVASNTGGVFDLRLAFISLRAPG